MDRKKADRETSSSLKPRANSVRSSSKEPIQIDDDDEKKKDSDENKKGIPTEKKQPSDGDAVVDDTEDVMENGTSPGGRSLQVPDTEPLVENIMDGAERAPVRKQSNVTTKHYSPTPSLSTECSSKGGEEKVSEDRQSEVTEPHSPTPSVSTVYSMKGAVEPTLHSLQLVSTSGQVDKHQLTSREECANMVLAAPGGMRCNMNPDGTMTPLSQLRYMTEKIRESRTHNKTMAEHTARIVREMKLLRQTMDRSNTLMEKQLIMLGSLSKTTDKLLNYTAMKMRLDQAEADAAKSVRDEFLSSNWNCGMDKDKAK